MLQCNYYFDGFSMVLDNTGWDFNKPKGINHSIHLPIYSTSITSTDLHPNILHI